MTRDDDGYEGLENWMRQGLGSGGVGCSRDVVVVAGSGSKGGQHTTTTTAGCYYDNTWAGHHVFSSAALG